MQQSNLYVIIYTAILTSVSGILLALASEGLKPMKEANIALDAKKNVLATSIDISKMSNAEVEKFFAAKVSAYVVNTKGEIIKGQSADKVNVSEEYSLPPANRKLPVYEIKNDAGEVITYVLPVYGFGLWNYISGYVGMDKDLNTIKGVVFAHLGETPGLGARITDQDIQGRYTKGKKVFKGEELVSIVMMKGEGNDYSADPHKVDGMSGATITGQGVNKMLMDYLTGYKAFLQSKQTKKVSLL